MTTKIPTAVIHPTSLKHPLLGFEGGGLFAGVGFADMAWRLAQRRTFKPWTRCAPRQKKLCKAPCPHCEYYLILDYAGSARWWPAGYRVRL